MPTKTRAAIFVAVLLGCFSANVNAGSTLTIVKTFNSVENRWELSVTNNSTLFNVYGFAIAENAATTANGETQTSGWWDAGVMNASNWDLGVSALSGFANQYITLPTFAQAFPGNFNRAVIYWMSGEENPMAPFPLIEVPFVDALESDDPSGADPILPGETAEIFSFTAVTAGSPFAALLGDGTATWSAEFGQTVSVADSDGDGVADDQDNCVAATNPAQADSDMDGIGNSCDQDIALPNDCIVNPLDLGALKAAFFSTPGDANWNPDADFTGDDAVNPLDLGAMKGAFFGEPGPSGIPNDCD